ncbi:MAG: sulfotransferase [Nitriliruptorales bacterium]
MQIRSMARRASMAARGSLAVLPHLRALEDVETFCLFVGYARSGHSLVGQMLDAHPEAVVAHELDALAFLRYPRPVLYGMLIRRARDFATTGSGWTGYSYRISGQWQGRYNTIRVIGDKKGGKTTGRLGEDPDLLRRLRARVGVPVKIVLVTRNPFDNIATLARRNGGDFEQALEYYTLRYKVVERLRADVGEDLLHLRHEDLVADPRRELSRLCDLFGLAPYPDYLEACAGVVLESPHRTSQEVAWPNHVREDVQDLTARFSFLHGYEQPLPPELELR